MTQFQRQPDDPNSHPIGHEGYCCDGCIQESNEGYGLLDPDTCCCQDKRDYDTRAVEYEAWLEAVRRG